MNYLDKTYKVKTLNNISAKALGLLTDAFTLNYSDEDVDAILVRSADMHEMPLAESVLFVGRAGSGVNNIPIEEYSKKGIVVSNAPGANANGVKELVIAAMIMASRNLPEGIQWTQDIKVDDQISEVVEKGKKQFNGPELTGKKIGIIGLGAIGVKVANSCVDLNMDVYGLDPYLSVEHALGLNPQTKTYFDIHYIMQNCDFISLHIPYSDVTKNYINANLLAEAKKGQIIINCARDGLVDLEALEDAINNQTIAKYVCDFPSEKSLTMPNTINIPHLGASTPESEDNAASMVVSELMDYLINGNIHHSVNFPILNLGQIQTVCRVTVLHQNIPNMLGQITTTLANYQININRLSNQHRNEWAYTIIDLDNEVNEECIDALKQIEGVVKVRLLSK